MIKINYECDDCGKFNQYTLNKELLLICEKCNNKFGTINIDWNYNCNCLFCSKKKFYKRKNFNQLFGLLVIILGGVLAITFYDKYGPLSYLILFVFSLFDFMLFKFTKYIGVCYSCSAEYINVKDVDLLPDFDHHQLEMYQK
tara:strand:+ start:351 stop:776 length:426 start_codon:yes stop_codon:yes gene_type:complete